MFSIRLSEDINAPIAVVWEVISRLEDYPQWNEFVVACESTLEVGSPIIMQVCVTSSSPRQQTETIRAHEPGQLLAYGMRAPLGLLSSHREHRLAALDANSTRYESLFELRGPLSPIVAGLLGANLRRGFSVMVGGLAARAESLYDQQQE